MAVQVQHRRGSTDDHSTFTGAVGEITVDTTKKTAVVHDGSTAGGVPLAKETDVTAAADNVVLTGYEIADTAALPASTDTINAAIGKLAKTASDNTTELAAKALQTHLTEKTGYGVISGLVVSAQTVADMTVKSSAGVAYMSNGTRYAPDAVASIAVTEADATNPRIDIVYLSSAGAVTYLAGTAAGAPVVPATPAGGLLLSRIQVAAGATSVVAGNIVSESRGMVGMEWIYPTMLNGNTSYADDPVRYRKRKDGMVEFSGKAVVANASIVFEMPAGYRCRTVTRFAVSNDSGTFATVAISTNNGVYGGVGTIHFTGLTYFPEV